MRKKPSAFMRLFLSLAFCFGYFDGFKTGSSIVTKPVTSSIVEGVTGGVKYIAVAVTQTPTKVV